MPALFTPPTDIPAVNAFKTGRSRTVAVAGGGTFSYDCDTWFLAQSNAGTQPVNSAPWGPADGNYATKGTVSVAVLVSTYACQLDFEVGGDYMAVDGTIWDTAAYPGRSASPSTHLVGTRRKFRAILLMTRGRVGTVAISQTFNGDWVVTPWYFFENGADVSPYPNEPAGYIQPDGTGTFAFGESDQLSECLGMDNRFAEDFPFEMLLIQSSSFSASANINVASHGSAYTCSVAGSLTIPADTAETSVRYGHGFTFSALGLHHALRGYVTYSDATLYSQYGTAPGAYMGFARLSGTWSDALFTWVGNDSTDALAHYHPTQDSTDTAHWTSSDPQGAHASVSCQPSWALQATVKAYDYATGNNIRTGMRHRWYGRGEEPWDDGTFPSGPDDLAFQDTTLGIFSSSDVGGALTPYRYPASGWQDTVACTASDNGGIGYTQTDPVHHVLGMQWDGNTGVGGSGSYSSGSFPGTDVLINAVSISHVLYFPTVAAPSAANPQHVIDVDPLWADVLGIYVRSKARRVTYRIHPERLEAAICADRFTQGTFQVDATHDFGLFGSSGPWASTFYPSANATVVGGSPFQITATALPAMIGTVNGGSPVKVIKPFGYRYYRLTARGSLDAMRFRFCVGAVGTVPAYAWEFKLAATGVDTVLEIDLASPTLKLISSTGGGLTWDNNTALVEPSSYFAPGIQSADLNGTGVWIEFLSTGTISLVSLEGYFKTDGARTPIRFYGPLEGGKDYEPTTDPDFGSYDSDAALAVGSPPSVGDQETQAEAEDQAVDPSPMMFRYVTNGVRGFDIQAPLWQFGYPPVFVGGVWRVSKNPAYTEQLTSLGAFWDRIKSKLDTVANDTGIHVTALTDAAYRLRHPVGNTDLTQSRTGHPFVLTPAPGDVWSILGQLRTHLRAGPPRGYPGMGDILNPAAGYDSLLQYTFEWVWNGEKIGAVPGGSGGGVSAELDDDDTGAQIATADSDDDGFLSFPAKYGVVFPIDNDTRTQQYAPSGAGPKPVVYTTTGKLFNAYWIKGEFEADEDTSGYLTVTYNPGAPDERTERRDVEILDRFPSWIVLPPGGLRGLCNLESRLGRYFIAYPDIAFGIRVSRSEATTPPFNPDVTDILATDNPADREPCLMLNPQGSPHEPERLRLLYARGGQLFARESDDGGETWDDETAMSIPNGKHPKGVYGAAGERLEAAVVGPNIQGTIQYLGDAAPAAPVTFVDDTGAPLAVVNDAFDLDPAREGEERIVMIVRIQGESAPSNWASAAYDYSTWERVD